MRWKANPRSSKLALEGPPCCPTAVLAALLHGAMMSILLQRSSVVLPQMVSPVVWMTAVVFGS